MNLKEYDLGCVLNAKKILIENSRHIVSLEGLAVEVGMNRTKLQYGFKLVTGLSIYDFQLKLRMDKAKDLLLNSRKSIKEIAKHVGYKSNSSFTVAFKKATGMPPLVWRNRGGDNEKEDNS